MLLSGILLYANRPDLKFLPLVILNVSCMEVLPVVHLDSPGSKETYKVLRRVAAGSKLTSNAISSEALNSRRPVPTET